MEKCIYQKYKWIYYKAVINYITIHAIQYIYIEFITKIVINHSTTHGWFGNFDLPRDISYSGTHLCLWLKGSAYLPLFTFKERNSGLFCPIFLKFTFDNLQAQSGLRSWNFTCPVRILQVSDIGLVLSFEDCLFRVKWSLP